MLGLKEEEVFEISGDHSKYGVRDFLKYTYHIHLKFDSWRHIPGRFRVIIDTCHLSSTFAGSFFL